MNNASATNQASGTIATVPDFGAGAIMAAMHGKGNNAPSIPKPFSNPICLVPHTRVAGTTHVDGIDELATSLSEGDHLRFERDANNQYDQWAIRVLDHAGRRLGFVAADVNEIPARLMDGGKRLYGEVTSVELVGNWWRINMGVWLDD